MHLFVFNPTYEIWDKNVNIFKPDTGRDHRRLFIREPFCHSGITLHEQFAVVLKLNIPETIDAYGRLCHLCIPSLLWY